MVRVHYRDITCGFAYYGSFYNTIKSLTRALSPSVHTIITMFHAIHGWSESDYSPTCRTREIEKRPFTREPRGRVPLTLSRCVTALFRIDTAGHCPLGIVVYAGCVTQIQTICRSRLFLSLLPAAVHLLRLRQRSTRSVDRIKKMSPTR